MCPGIIDKGKKQGQKTVRSMTYNIIVKITVLKMCKIYSTPERKVL